MEGRGGEKRGIDGRREQKGKILSSLNWCEHSWLCLVMCVYNG